ncbi:MAG: response regulator [Elusimicrobiota bacterium]
METPDILIIDDDADLRRTLVLLLEKKYRVVAAAGGREALVLLKAQKPRLVLLDITMPEMSGIEVLRAAKELDKTLRVVMLTSHQEIEFAKSALDLGAIEYLTKPFEADFIRGEVARLLAPPDDKKDGGRPWRVVE